MNNKITIITICSRPEYLDKIYNSIKYQNYNNFEWIISFDAEDKPKEIPFKLKNGNDITKIKLVNYKNKETDVTNYAAINNIFDNYIKEDTWCHIIDDDNILYPNYFNIINDKINSNSNLKFIYYQQQYQDGIFRFGCRTNDIKEGHIDMAQVCFNSSIIEDTRFIQKYTADGIFYNTLFNKTVKDKSTWCVIPQYLCYYNYIVNSTKESTILNQKKKIKNGVIKPKVK